MNGRRMAASDEHKIHKINNGPGLYLEGHASERMRGLWVTEEGGDTVLRITIDHKPGIDEVMQYLGPTEAMRVGQAVQACAIAALRNRAKW